MRRELARSPLCDQYPAIFELGRFQAENRLLRLRSSVGIVTSKQIQSVIHGESDYAFLDARLGRGHTYEEGIVFVQGFYDTLDVSWDFAVERES